jgi:hypothetical protein
MPASGHSGGENARGTGPLLVDLIPGQDRELPFSQLGQALMTLGVMALMAGVLAILLSGPSLDLGWEGSWYVPRGELVFVLPFSLAMMAAGAILHVLGRRTQRSSPVDGGGPPPGRDRTGTGK